MSIEFLGTPVPSLDQPTINHLFDRLSRSGFGRPVRQSISEWGFTTSNAAEVAIETTTVGLNANRVYIAFHAAGRSERETLLAIAHRSFHELGIKCELKEE